MNQSKHIYSLIPMDDFKQVLSVDDRDDRLCRYCLVTSTYTIEQYCHRRLLVKKHFEDLAFWGDRVIPLNHYPVQEILAVYKLGNGEWGIGSGVKNPSITGEMIESEFYGVVPEIEEGFDTPACLVLSPGIRLLHGEKSLKVVYKAGYSRGKVPTDLAAACLELASWNMSRYKGRRIGMTGNVRSGGKDGEHLELAMPVNVCKLLEPYRQKLI